LVLFAFDVQAEEKHQRVLVVDPYLELRTGPGRGFPVFYVAERDEWVEILVRRTDWFKIRTERGKEGWTSRQQMENTLTEAGVKKSFRDVLLEDYLKRRLEIGFAAGRLEDDSLLSVRAGYKLTDNLLAEFTIAQVSGDFSSTTLYYASLVSQPFPEWRLSPFFTLGAGRFENTPKATLVGGVKTKADMANVGIGARYYLTRRFLFRLDYKTHVVLISDNRTDDYQEWSAGFSFFF
jgi:hypothetical protein